MEANVNFQSLTAEDVEKAKRAIGFDQLVTNHLIPRGFHALGSLVNDKLEEVVREEINPAVIGFLRAGGDKTPRSVFDKKTVKSSRSLRAGDALSQELRRFLDMLSERNNFEMTKKQKRAYSRQLNRTVTEMIRRTDFRRPKKGRDET